MKSTKKILATIAAVFVIFCVIVAAGCTTAEQDTTPATVTATPTSASEGAVSGEVTVLAATSLTKAMNEIIEQFEAANPNIDVKASYGGSNALVTQMTSGAVDADVFFSADTANMKKVLNASLADDSNTLLHNSLICVVTKGNPKNITGLDDLIKEDVGIASGVDGVPFASYGTGMAEKYEKDGHTGYLESFKKNIRTKAQNVAEARTAVVTGDCDAAIIYKTDYAGFEDKLDIVDIPEKYNTVTDLPYTILKAAKDDEATKVFVAYMTGEDGKTVFAKYGFVIA